MEKIDCNLMLSKFRGALLGALVGDCCGLPYEFDDIADLTQSESIKKDLDNLEGNLLQQPLIRKYSDDTAMTKVLALTLLNGFTQEKLAKNFSEEYVNDPRRGYGTHVQTVFLKLQKEGYQNPTGPARQQFGGQGSFGNGSAMRIAPVALYCWNDLGKLQQLVKETSEPTHTVS